MPLPSNRQSSLLIFAIMGLFISLTGCSGNNNSQSGEEVKPADNAASNQSPTKNQLDYISPLPENAPTYKVATEASYEPFVFQNEYGRPVGLDVDLLRAIGEEQGFKVEFYTMPWTEVPKTIQESHYDLAMSGIHIMDELLTIMSASEPYLTDKLQIISLKSAPITSIADLANKKVGIQDNTIAIPQELTFNNAQIVKSNTVFSLFENLAQGKTDAFLVDKAVGLYIVQQFPETEVSFAPFGEETHQIAFYTNQNNTELMKKINAGLGKIKQNGKYQKINEKWFGNNANELMIK